VTEESNKKQTKTASDAKTAPPREPETKTVLVKLMKEAPPAEPEFQAMKVAPPPEVKVVRIEEIRTAPPPEPKKKETPPAENK
jgi:hypothetical protein